MSGSPQALAHQIRSESVKDPWEDEPVDIRLVAQKILIAVIFIIAFVNSGEETAPPPADTAMAPEVESTEAASPEEAAVPTEVNGARIANADSEPGNWLAHGRTYSEQRYSPLTQINTDTASDLGFLWEYDTDTIRGLEATPIVVDGIMYTSGSWSKVYAVDARTGKEIWTFDPEVPGSRARMACCDVVNRGVAVWKGRVYVASLDGRLIALNAETGTPEWSVQTFDISKPYTITGAPRIVKGKVVIGNGGAEYGVRGYITAYDADTGEQAWRFYIVPGNPEDPLEHPEMAVAMETWDAGDSDIKWWDVGGGGTAWDAMAYDPELDLLYVGTGNGAPWNRMVRSAGGGDNLYLSSILAIKPDSGQLVWHYQTTPGENWDYTATQHMILAELEIDGETRQVIMQAPKNGFFYVLDRATGELLSAEKYGKVNWATHVDMETGRPVEVEELHYVDGVKTISPAPGGAHNWHPMAFSPDTGLVYIPAVDGEFYYNHVADYVHEHGAWNTGNDFAVLNAVLGSVGINNGVDLNVNFNTGLLKAWDPVAGKLKWEIPHKTTVNGGLLATAGGLLLQGTGDGYLLVLNAATGQTLNKIKTGTGIIAPPITYTVDGEQYISVMAGFGGGGHASAFDPDIAIHEYGNAGRILTFKLGTGKTVPIPQYDQLEMTQPPASTATPEQIATGAAKFAQTCGICHGLLARGLGQAFIPDLRYSVGDIHDMYNDIVLEGALEQNGMASFADILDEQDVDDLRAYVIFEANILWDSQNAAE
jgi:quinohemoprotein ethanol dehydrogenase